MKTWIKVVLGLVIVGIAAFVAWILFLWFTPNPNKIIPSNSVEYHTKEELTDLYWQNKTVLNAVKESVISSKSLLRALDEYKEGDIDVRFQSDKEYFNDDEWENIVTVFEKLHPSMLMLERKGRPLIFYLTFRQLNSGFESKVVYLYWFPNEDEREYHEKPTVFPDGVFSQLDEGWYIIETEETR